VTLKTGVMMLKNKLCITGINYILQCIKIEISYFKLRYFSILLFLQYFDQRNASLVSIRYFFKKH